MSSENAKTTRLQNNVRQLGSSASNANGQHQILSALDTLGAKLVRSESERETMRRLLNEALEAQDRLETQLERSQINIQRRIDQMEDKNTGLSIEDKDFIEEQKQKVAQTKEVLDDQFARQLRVEDKLRDSQQTIQKMQRRLDSQEQKRAKLQRRIERVENIAADAQNALEAKAIVLLTDQSEQVRHLRDLQEEQATHAMKTLNLLHSAPANDVLDQDDSKKSWLGRFKSNGSVLPLLVALGLGWFMASNTQTDMPTLVLNENGQLAQIDLREFNTTQRQTTIAETPTLNTAIENDIVAFETDWITNDILEQALNGMEEGEAIADETATATTAPFDVLQTMARADITMDRDLSLPNELRELEDSAFAKIPEAQHDLAALYTAGQAGVTQNYERAGFWFQQAAEQGIGNAAYNLGVLFQQGLGQEQDLQRALDWYRRAAQLGHPEAQYNLGIAYIEGVGTRYNPNMAAAFFQQAAFGGIAEAAYNLGLILENGLLGEVRPNDALKWYRGAADNGNAEARQALTTLGTELNIPLDQAGMLDDGTSLALLMTPLQNLEPAAGGDNAREIAKDVDLGTLIPTQDQILVAQIQEQLRKAGLYNGPQDGIIGAGTVRAIKTFQGQNNISTDGKATPQLLTYMLQQGTGE